MSESSVSIQRQCLTLILVLAASGLLKECLASSASLQLDDHSLGTLCSDPAGLVIDPVVVHRTSEELARR